MNDYVSAYHSMCPGCVLCTECDERAYCTETENLRPCGHGRNLCEDHRDACPLCRMFTSGVWSTADPLHTGPDGAQTLPEVLREQRAHLERRKAESGFDPVTNSQTTYYLPKDSA